MSSSVSFLRVSSADQRDGFSLDAQRTLAEKYIDEKGLSLLKNWAVDESAANHADRKHFFEMLEFVKANNVKNVIFDKIDRAVRNLESAVEIEKLIKDGVKFHFVREHLIIDENSPSHEKMRFYLGLILATYYVDNLRAEIKKGLDARTAAGLWNHIAPFGYKNIREGKANRAIVVFDEVEAPIAKEVFELYSTGNYTLESLTKFIKEKLPQKNVTKRLVENLLASPFYIGYLPARGQRKPEIKGAHKPLIDRALWEAVQKIKGIRAAQHQGFRKGIPPKPLMGLFKCGACDHAVTGESHKKPSGKVFVYYHCANPKCDQRRINSPEPILIKQLELAFEPFGGFTAKATRSFIDCLKGRMEDLDLYTQKMSGQLAEKRLAIKKAIDRLEELRKEGRLTDEEFSEVMRIKESALSEVKREIDAYNEADYKTFNEGLRLIELFTSIRSYMRTPGNELEKVRLAKLVLSNPTLKDRTIEYHYKKPFDVLLDLTSNKNWWR